MWTNENLETVVDALNEMLPAWGSVTNINKNRCLERFRTAQNVVHDIFNNGLMNKGKSLKVLGLMKYDLPLPQYAGGHYYDGNWDRIKEIVEPIFENIILDAAVEQDLSLELVPIQGKIEVQVKA